MQHWGIHFSPLRAKTEKRHTPPRRAFSKYNLGSDNTPLGCQEVIGGCLTFRERSVNTLLQPWKEGFWLEFWNPRVMAFYKEGGWTQTRRIAPDS